MRHTALIVVHLLLELLAALVLLRWVCRVHEDFHSYFRSYLKSYLSLIIYLYVLLLEAHAEDYLAVGTLGED